MTIGWFKCLHDWLIAVRDYLYGALRELPIYRLIRATLDRLKVAARQWWASLRGRRGIGARWRAIRRWYRQKRIDTPRGPE